MEMKAKLQQMSEARTVELQRLQDQLTAVRAELREREAYNTTQEARASAYAAEVTRAQQEFQAELGAYQRSEASRASVVAGQEEEAQRHHEVLRAEVAAASQNSGLEAEVRSLRAALEAAQNEQTASLAERQRLTEALLAEQRGTHESAAEVTAAAAAGVSQRADDLRRHELALDDERKRAERRCTDAELRVQEDADSRDRLLQEELASAQEEATAAQVRGDVLQAEVARLRRHEAEELKAYEAQCEHKGKRKKCCALQ